jgi:serine/threonine-protein kinase 40
MKQRASERGAGEMTARAEALGPGIAGNNIKRANGCENVWQQR